MKRVLKYTDLTLLRLIPTMCLIFFLYSDIRDSIQAFNRFPDYSLRLFLPNFVFVLCFVLLGFYSILKLFIKTKLFLAICKCLIGIAALIYIGLYVADRIEAIRLYNSLGYQPKFFDSHLDISQIIYILAFSIVIICSTLKDKFFRTKCILTILCSLLFFVASFCAPLYLLINYNDIGLRMLVNSFLFSYCYCAVIITGLAPLKIKHKTIIEETNEENQNI